MMAHIRTTIRDGVRSLLTEAAPVGWQVDAGRGRAINLDRLPFVELAIPRETVERGGACQRKRRDMELTVTAYVASAVNGDAEADAAALWLEASLDADATLGGIVSDCTHRASEISPHPGGETPVWALTLTYDIRVS